MAATSRVKPIHLPGVIDRETSLASYTTLRDTIAWEDSITGKLGYTRKAKPMRLGDNEVVDLLIATAISALGLDSATVGFVYLNYYRDGNDYCPNHTHKREGTNQVVISLGATRTLKMATKDYEVASGDVAMFGPSTLHGVAKQTEIKEGRISIACFLI